MKERNSWLCSKSVYLSASSLKSQHCVFCNSVVLLCIKHFSNRSGEMLSLIGGIFPFSNYLECDIFAKESDKKSKDKPASPGRKAYYEIGSHTKCFSIPSVSWIYLYKSWSEKSTGRYELNSTGLVGSCNALVQVLVITVWKAFRLRNILIKIPFLGVNTKKKKKIILRSFRWWEPQVAKHWMDVW